MTQGMPSIVKYGASITTAYQAADNNQAIDYGQGVLTMRVNKDNKIVEVFNDIDDDESENDRMLKNPWYKIGVDLSNRKQAIHNTEFDQINEAMNSNFNELIDQTAMKRVIAKLGRTKFHTYKLIAISIKLVLNLIVGAIFYTLNLGLFNTLAESM